MRPQGGAHGTAIQEDNEEFLLYLGIDSEVPPFANTT